LQASREFLALNSDFVIGTALTLAEIGDLPEDSFSYEDYAGHAGPAFTHPPRGKPFTEREADMLLDAVRVLREKRAEHRAMKGGKEANQRKKELRAVEQDLIKHLVIGRRYSGFDWPEQRIAVHIKGAVQKDGTVRGMALLIFSDEGDHRSDAALPQRG
jgi:hypothetical protein